MGASASGVYNISRVQVVKFITETAELSPDFSVVFAVFCCGSGCKAICSAKQLVQPLLEINLAVAQTLQDFLVAGATADNLANLRRKLLQSAIMPYIFANK